MHRPADSFPGGTRQSGVQYRDFVALFAYVRDQQIVLGAEVMVETPYRNPGGRADFLQRNRVKTVAIYQGNSGRENSLSRLLAFRRERSPGIGRPPTIGSFIHRSIVTSKSLIDKRDKRENTEKTERIRFYSLEEGSSMATVIVEHAPQNDYEPGCVVLPPEYGTPGWEALPEVSAIRTTVFAALDRLHSEASIGDRFSGRPVLVKPNLVLVYHDMGTVKRDYPETTDPRVFDAVIQWQ